jgi:uncharacterized protein YndB with AHSA1/START domain
MTSTPDKALAQWDIEREIVLSRVIKAKREFVFAAWTDPDHLPRWFGPAGFTVETREIDIRVGGVWRFDMVAPTGQRFASRMYFRRIESPRLIEFDHGSDMDDDPARFRTTITFDEQSDGKTVVTLRQIHPTKAQRDSKIGFGAVEYGYQTLDKLAAHVEAGTG